MRVLREYWIFLTLTGAALCVVGLYVALVAWWPLTSLTLAEKLALGEVVVGGLALSIALLAVYLAFHEFRRATAGPKLALFDWVSGAQRGVVTPSGLYEKLGCLEFGIRNDGSAVTPWWQATLYLPRALSEELSVVPPFDGTAGWNATQVTEDYQVWVYVSGGRHAVFVGAPLLIGTLHCVLERDREYERSYELPYMIVSDRSEPVRGKLSVSVALETDDNEDNRRSP